MIDPVSTAPSVDDLADRADCIEVVRAAIKQCRSTLSSKEQRVLDLLLEDLERGEIAKVLKITPNYAGVLTFDVRHKLRDCLRASASANHKLTACLGQMSGYGLLAI